MEQSKNKNVVVGLLVVIIVILLGLVALLATGTINFKSNERVTESTNGSTNESTNGSTNESTNGSTNENDNQDNATIESLINSVKITNFTFDKPHGMSFGGAEKSNALGTNMTINLECTNDIISGLRVEGYCLDLDNNKYSFSGPAGVMGFACNNNSNYAYPVSADQLFKTDGSHYMLDNYEASDSWETIEIKYCKFDEAHLVLSDGSMLQTKMELNYEKEFK